MRPRSSKHDELEGCYDGCGVALFAFGLLQMYEMGQSIASEDWTMTAVNAIGGNLIMFSALSLYSTEVKA